jgi:hypothetical protein
MPLASLILTTLLLRCSAHVLVRTTAPLLLLLQPQISIPEYDSAITHSVRDCAHQLAKARRHSNVAQERVHLARVLQHKAEDHLQWVTDRKDELCHVCYMMYYVASCSIMCYMQGLLHAHYNELY